MIIRQGDIKIESINKPSVDNLTAKPDLVLAEGEVTGHSHRILSGQVKLFWDQNIGGSMVLDVKTPAELFHEEHETVTLPPGTYKIDRQVEWDWMSKLSRKVSD